MSGTSENPVLAPVPVPEGGRGRPLAAVLPAGGGSPRPADDPGPGGRAAVGGIGACGVVTAFINSTASLFLVDAVKAAPLLIGMFFAARGAVSIVVSLAAGAVSDRTPDRRPLLVIGMYSSTFMSASLLAGAVTGVTASAIGYGDVFWVCARLSAAATGLLLARAVRSAGRQGDRRAPFGLIKRV